MARFSANTNNPNPYPSLTVVPRCGPILGGGGVRLIGFEAKTRRDSFVLRWLGSFFLFDVARKGRAKKELVK